MRDEEFFEEMLAAKPRVDMVVTIVLALAIAGGFSIVVLFVVFLKQAFALHILPELVARTLAFVS